MSALANGLFGLRWWITAAAGLATGIPLGWTLCCRRHNIPNKEHR